MYIPETKYAKSGNMHIAYQVIGEGHFDLLFLHGWISHIEYLWEEPSIARFLCWSLTAAPNPRMAHSAGMGHTTALG
jgi:hypothetical protein